MKKRFAAFALALSMVFSSVITPVTADAAQSTQKKTTAAGSEYEVTLPDDYAISGKNYPVIYVMPQDGVKCDDSGLSENLVTAMETEEAMDMIVVRPAFVIDTDLHSTLADIVADVDANYHTIPTSECRVIAGTGVGGYLSYILGLTENPTQQAVVVSQTEEEPVTEEPVEEEPVVEEPAAEEPAVEEPAAEEPAAEEPVTEEPVEEEPVTEEPAAEEPVEEEPVVEEPTAEEPAAEEPAAEEPTAEEPAVEEPAAEEPTEEEPAPAAAPAASVPAPLAGEEDATPFTALTEPGLFKSIVSVRGDFVSDANKWKVYGDVAAYVNEMGADVFNEFYTYIDAPVNDPWTNMEGSSNDLGHKFIDYGTGSDEHEFTVRPGSFDAAYLKESASRVMNRVSTVATNGIVSGSVSLEKAALTADEKTVTVNYSVTVKEKFASFVSKAQDVDMVLSIVDPSTKQVLASTTVTEEFAGAGTASGKVKMDNLVNGSASDVRLSVNLFGKTFLLGSATLIRIQDTVIDGDYQKIDLMGDWYFNYVGAKKRYPIEEITPEEYTTWSTAQPALSNWYKGYGNISDENVNCPWPDYFNFFITGSGYYARTFEVPENFDAEEVILSLGYVDDRCEAWINGVRVGATGLDENGEPTGKTTWAVYSKYEIDPEILVKGGTNTVVVRAWNDLGVGAGGWYNGPVGLYSKAALESSVEDSRLVEHSFDSAYAAKATKAETETVENKYLLYLPEDYDSTDRYYPTVYLLHQFNSDHTSYRTDKIDQLLDNAIKAGLFDEMIVVIPNSAESSWWCGDWEKMVTEELMPLIDANYRTIKDARYRLTAGCSMGGQGAFSVALGNPDLFSGAISFFGALSMAPESGVDAIEAAKTESAAYLDYYTLYFICGNQDSYGFGKPAIELNKILESKGIEHGFFIENGGHDSNFYVPYFTSAFQYARDNMYKSDVAVEQLLEGAVTVDGSVVTADFEALKGIYNYFNVIPKSTYTKNTNPDLSIPLSIQVTQDDEVVYEYVERDFTVAKDKTTWNKDLDIAEYVDTTKEYSVTFRAAIFDRMVELDTVTVEMEKENGNPIPPTDVTYVILSGADQIVEDAQKADGTLSIRVNAPVGKFVSVEVDGKLVDKANYDVIEGSTIIKFKKAFLDSLTKGVHKVKINFVDGSVETTMIVKESPTGTVTGGVKTGDDTMVAEIIVLLFGAAAVTVLLTKKRILTR